MAKIAILLATLGAAAAAAATSSLAPRVDQLPDCSIQCITDGAADFGCQLTDFNCLCSQLEDLVAQVSPCLVHAGCGMTEVTGKQPASHATPKPTRRVPYRAANTARRHGHVCFQTLREQLKQQRLHGHRRELCRPNLRSRQRRGRSIITTTLWFGHGYGHRHGGRDNLRGASPFPSLPLLTAVR